MSAELNLLPSPVIEAKEGSFIFEQHNALTSEQCDYLIRTFDSHPEDHREGVIGVPGGEVEVDRSIKQSTDCKIMDQSHWQRADRIFFESVNWALRQLVTDYGFDSFAVNPVKDMGYMVRRYDEDEFYDWHTDGGKWHYALRQLVFLWYLNDVEEGGCTEFAYQDVNVKPEKGKLAIFPPFWTHKHRGGRVLSGPKYVATTWISLD
jgi:hypothetical protein